MAYLYQILTLFVINVLLSTTLGAILNCFLRLNRQLKVIAWRKDWFRDFDISKMIITNVGQVSNVEFHLEAI